MINAINILGQVYRVERVPVVSRDEFRLGEIDLMGQVIRLDWNMTHEQERQVLLHEIIHGILHGLGFYEEYGNEHLVQSLATGLHQVFSMNEIFNGGKTL